MKLIQYIIIRTDLDYGIGGLVCQACHAVAACQEMFKDSGNMKKYLKTIPDMHKVILGIGNETELKELYKKLIDNNIECSLWMEMPEKEATAIAIVPMEKETVRIYLKDYKLLR